MTMMRMGDLEIKSSQIMDVLLDYFPDIVHSVDKSGQIVFTNRRAVELLGYSRDELLGMNVREIYAPEILEDMERGFLTLQEEGDLKVLESRLVTANGERIDVEIRSFALYNDDGTFLRTVSVLRDIRNRKNLESQLVHSSRLAAVGELSSCIAHDISNPLAVVKLYCQMMQQMVEDGLSADNLQDLYDQINATAEAADKIGKLVNHLRNFARSGDQEMVRVDLAEVLDGALFMISAKLKGISVNNSVAHGSYVTGRPNELEQVFMNLFSNACDAMRTVMDREPKLTISCQILEGRCSVIVKDNGCGMSEEVLDKMFQSFFTTKPVDQGTGLGMSITKSILEKHEAELRVESTVGQGTTFIITMDLFKYE